MIRDALLKAEILCSKRSNCQEKEAVIWCGTCHGSLCKVWDDIVHKMLPLGDRTIFIDGYEHPLLSFETLNNEEDIEATAKTTRPISAKFSVVLSPFRKKLSYCKYWLYNGLSLIEKMPLLRLDNCSSCGSASLKRHVGSDMCVAVTT